MFLLEIRSILVVLLQFLARNPALTPVDLWSDRLCHFMHPRVLERLPAAVNYQFVVPRCPAFHATFGLTS